MGEFSFINFEAKIDKIQPYNSNFSKCIIAIAYAGKNQNNSIIPKEVFDKALPSLKNVPIVACLNEDCDDFEGHSVEMVQDDNNVKFVPKTIPVGVVSESCNQWWSAVKDSDGTVREYLFTEAFLWQRQQKEYSIIENRKIVSQSMEISVNSYTKNLDKTCEVHDMEFEALCLLGENVQPCFEKAHLQLDASQQNDFCLKFSQMLKDFKTGGEIEMENTIKDNFENSLENNNSNENIQEDTIKESFENEQVVENVTSEENNENVEDESQVYSITYSISHDNIRHSIYQSMQRFRDIAIIEVSNDYFVYFDYREEKQYKMNYSLNNDIVEISGEPIEVFTEYLTLEEKENIKQQYTLVEKEVEELRKYKADVELEKINNAKSEIFAKWSGLIGDTSDFEEVKNNKDNFSVQEIENKCKCIYADNTAVFEKNSKKENNLLKFRLSEEEDSVNDTKYGGLIERFRNK